MIEQGMDRYGAEYKRSDKDFHVRSLEQDNCVCSICHGTGAKLEIRYITRNYQNVRTKKICENLQSHEHSLWICPKCISNFILWGGDNVNTAKTTEMTFREAWFQMLGGKKVKRPLWSGFWAWEDGTIMMHCRDGQIIDIRQTDNVAYTFDNVASRDWMVVDE